MASLFSLIGDSNVRQHVTKNTCRASPNLKASQVLFCGNLETFVSSLEKVRVQSNVCLVSCITNFLASAEGSTSVSHRVEPVLREVHAGLMEACLANPTRKYMLAPPMYQMSPLWYREGLPEILNLFSQVMNSEKAENLHLLSSFATPDFDKSGTHLTPYSGMEFVLSLFDAAQEIIDNQASGAEQKTARSCELTRVLEDRVVALEQDHRRLNRVVDDKIAIDAELADALKNERFEDTFVVEGLPRIPDDIVGKAWQDQALRDTKAFIKSLMGREMSVVFVSNATKRVPDAIVTYNVKMQTVSDSKAIRTKFGTYFLGQVDRRPEAMKPYSVKNRLTPETKIRISVLKLLAKRYRDSNPGDLNYFPY